MRRYRLSRPAKADLDRIWFRIAREASIETADRFVDTITARFQFSPPCRKRAEREVTSNQASIAFLLRITSSITAKVPAAES